jgi:hypothetical protein
MSACGRSLSQILRSNAAFGAVAWAGFDGGIGDTAWLSGELRESVDRAYDRAHFRPIDLHVRGSQS